MPLVPGQMLKMAPENTIKQHILEKIIYSTK